MSSCDHFTQNAWRPDLCSTCQRSRSEHDSGGTASRASWRRRSEPNPNNIISGARITALASKFQDVDTGSSKESDIIRARTLDRKYIKSKSAAKKLNASQSSDFLETAADSDAIESLSLATSKNLEGSVTSCLLSSNQKLICNQSVRSKLSNKSTELKPGASSSGIKSSIRSAAVSQGKSNNSSSIRQQPNTAVSSLKTPKRKVNIADGQPEIIGTDGGLDNLYLEEEILTTVDAVVNENIALSEEEKQFTLLALGNTLWNSDNRNLQIEADAAKRNCRDLEDLKLDELLVKERFKSLVDCDAIKQGKPFGTFPKSSGVKQLKVSVDSVRFNGIGTRCEADDSSAMFVNSSLKPGAKESKVSTSSRVNSEVSPSDSGADVRTSGQDLNVKDVLYECPEDVVASDITSSTFDFESESSQSVLDSLQAIALLNDVLKDYGDFNESSTDDWDFKDKKDLSKVKKSSDFEAKMASLAANLDLTQQQRRKRQAPRPPVSPPPEPSVAPAVSPKKAQSQPEPVFKMVTVGKTIVTLPAQQDIPNQVKTTSQAPLGLEDFPLSAENADSKQNGEIKGKKGLTSFFKNILRRGKESSDSFEFQNPEVQLLVKAKDASGHSENLTNQGDESAGTSVDKIKPLIKQSSTAQNSPQHAGETTPVDVLGKVWGEVTAISASSSPTLARKKGMVSPKLMLKKATAKFSPPLSRHPIKDTSAGSVAIKPHPAPKPSVPPPSKPAVLADSPDLSETSHEFAQNVKMRPKSPKRNSPPMPPSRVSVVSNTSTLNRNEMKETMRRSLPMPPSPPEDHRTSPQVSPIHETESSLPSSPSYSNIQTFDPAGAVSSSSTSTIEDEPPKFTEKIELPTVANPGRKGFLGKLGGTRKTRAPQPPSVKRAKSITESSTLPRGDKKNKRINAADISGPMIVTDATNNRVLENRRNTISLGDDPFFNAVFSSSSQTTGDKNGFDEFNLPQLSPLGSLENLYESILPKPEGTTFHYYDPPTSQKTLCPNIPSDGYLEPVPPLTLTSALPTNVRLPTVNRSVPKTENQSIPSRDSSHSGHTTSGTSSQSESTENSGSSMPDMSTEDMRNPEGLGPNFEEPEMTEQRRLLLAAQPIYEEIPNGNNEEEEDDIEERKGVIKQNSMQKKTSLEKGSSLQKAMLPSLTTGMEMTKSQIAHAWLQQPHVTGPPPTSPSHAKSSLTSSMTASQMAVSMSASLSSSMLPPPPPPPDHLPATVTSRSVSRETVSSESDSNCSTLSRPLPAPRRRPKRPETSGADQYVSMNRPNAQVSLSEEKLRDVFGKLTSITFHALQDIYSQCEQVLAADKLDIPNANILKWADFDIYGQALHASGRCIVYNAKFKASGSPCQLMILHSRPATERCPSSHPSLLRPSAVFADTIPFSYLTPDFIKTSQLLQNSVYDSCQARCFVAVGAFDVVERLDSHLVLLRETLVSDPSAYLNITLTCVLQLLSAMSHCLDQGYSVTETDYNDVFLITRSDLRGKVVAFMPHQRSSDIPQGEAMCNFLDRLLMDAMPGNEEEDEFDDVDDEDEKIVLSPKKTVAKIRSMLEPRKVECLSQVRTAVEYLLWGPSTSELPPSPLGLKPISSASTGAKSSKEQELYVWLEKERALTVGRMAKSLAGLGAGLNLEDFYTLKFLLKSSAACLAESLRRLSR